MEKGSGKEMGAWRGRWVEATGDSEILMKGSASTLCWESERSVEGEIKSEDTKASALTNFSERERRGEEGVLKEEERETLVRERKEGTVVGGGK